MLTQKGLPNDKASIASILMKTGACVGGTIMGYMSQWIGRRRTMVLSAFLAGCLIPAWILPTTEGGLSASGFMIQFFVQGTYPMNRRGGVWMFADSSFNRRLGCHSDPSQ